MACLTASKTTAATPMASSGIYFDENMSDSDAEMPRFSASREGILQSKEIDPETEEGKRFCDLLASPPPLSMLQSQCANDDTR